MLNPIASSSALSTGAYISIRLARPPTPPPPTPGSMDFLGSVMSPGDKGPGKLGRAAADRERQAKASSSSRKVKSFDHDDYDEEQTGTAGMPRMLRTDTGARNVKHREPDNTTDMGAITSLTADQRLSVIPHQHA